MEMIVLIHVVYILMVITPNTASTVSSTSPALPDGPGECTYIHDERGDVVSANCSDKGFTKVPRNLPSTLLYLNLNQNEIYEIEQGDFNFLPRLVKLHLFRNHLSQLKDNSFDGLVSLENLDLSYNDFTSNYTSISELAFNGLTKLNTLDICHYKSNQGSVTYPVRALEHLPSLTTLRMNGIADIPLGHGFTRLKELTTLTFVNNLGEINRQTFANLAPTKLSSLSILFCVFSCKDPGSLAMLTHLNFLDLSFSYMDGWNTFQELTYGIQNTSIQAINISRINMVTYQRLYKNYLVNFKYTNLTFLDMNFNLMYIMRDSLNFLPQSLKVLYLRYNLFHIRDLLITMRHLIHLEYLDCSHGRFAPENALRHSDKIAAFTQNDNQQRKIQNKIRSSDEAGIKDYQSGHGNFTRVGQNVNDTLVFPKLARSIDSFLLPPNLKEFYAIHVDTIYFGPKVIFSKNVLEVFDLSDNQLTVLNLLCSLHHLRNFTLSNNKISNIDPLALSDMPRLEVLYLDGNALGDYFIHDHKCDTFGNLPTLTVLKMNSNGIQILQKCIFSRLFSLRQLYLHHNAMVNVMIDVSHLKKLEILDLSHNQITALDRNVYSALDRILSYRKTPMSLFLDGNPLTCGCEDIDFLYWMSRTSVTIHNASALTCQYVNGSKISLDNIDVLLQDLWFYCNAMTVVWVCIAWFGATSLILTIPAVLYHKRWKLRYLYYIGRRHVIPYKPLLEEDHEEAYDVYLSFADASRPFVQRLEHYLTTRGYRVYIPEVTGEAGRQECVEIVNSIGQCACVLVFLTNDYDKIYHRYFEFNIAVHETIGRNYQNIIPVIVEPLRGNIEREISMYLRANPSYPVWKWKEDELFKTIEDEINSHKENWTERISPVNRV